MADPLPAETPGQADLQFEQAEYASPTAAAETTCGACKRPIGDAYYALNHLVLCPECRGRVEQQWRGGSRLGRFAKAAALGSIAAVGGFAIYFGVLKLTGYEVGLISILVGVLVGGAVRKGSGGRGGWAYQGLAMFLTYTAIAVSYSALVIPELFAKREAERAEIQAGEVAKAGPAAPAPVEPAKVDEAKATLPLPLALALFAALVAGFVYAVPIIAGFQQPISLFIIGFALWEAWKINRRVRIEIQGPFALGQGGSEPVPAHA
ncbi:MAG TPA: hypothetical protein VGH33_23730 [Isosphaeraceae bacterium]|jgi:hypothetical protein